MDEFARFELAVHQLLALPHDEQARHLAARLRDPAADEQPLLHLELAAQLIREAQPGAPLAWRCEDARCLN